MADALATRGHEVHLVTYGYGEYGLEPAYRVHRIPALPFSRSFRSGPSAPKLLLDPLLALKILRVASREDIDVIHAHNHEAVLVSYPAARLLGIPLVYHSHTILPEEFPTYWKRAPAKYLSRKLALVLEKLTISLADHLIAVSEEEMRLFAKSGRKREDITCIPPGITLEDYSPEEIVEEEGALCYMGNLDAYQDLPTLFRAVKLAAERREETRLYVVTRSDWQEPLKEAARMGIGSHVSFQRPDTFPEALSLLMKCRLALITRNIPSGFPVKLLDYMASGRAIIATRSSSKMLTHGENALVVEDGDHEALARAILLLLRDDALRERLGRSARDLAQREFTWESRMGPFESIYEKLRARKEAFLAA
jgi:glycosyltransferase involved in cell wall biosynthesis